MSETMPSTWSSMEAMVNQHHVLHALPDSQITNDESNGQESDVNTNNLNMELDLDKNSCASFVVTSGLTASSGSTVPFASTVAFETTTPS
ncbi:hypothetical protein BGZ97_010298 [Linnemannia gamsii]|uniref:Uncharacterized protein n=1 Tax=Linnemannia gamsii TaxID=64522 RepID=A0A9P6UP34_9FUNG|nr:hypothetical protein BGZ97_010298 [Linnemannia gamsii]